MILKKIGLYSIWCIFAGIGVFIINSLIPNSISWLFFFFVGPGLIIAGLIIFIIGVITPEPKEEDLLEESMYQANFKGALRDRKAAIPKPKFYFGEPHYGDIYTDHWNYAILGDTSFHGSTLIFTAEDFTPTQPKRNLLLDPYFNDRSSRGTLILKLDLGKLSKIKKKIHQLPSFNRVWLRFEVHGAFLNDNIKDLNFTIRSNSRKAIKILYNKILNAKDSHEFDPEQGSLKYIVNDDLEKKSYAC